VLVDGNNRGPKTLMRHVTEVAVADSSSVLCTQVRDGEAPVKAVATPASPPQSRRQRGASQGKGNAQGGQKEGQVHDDTDKEDSAIDARKYKTKLCRNWQSGTPCPYGDRCVFAHGGKDMRRAEDPNPYLANQAPTSGSNNRRSSGGGSKQKGPGGSSNTSSQPRGPVASTTIVVGGSIPPMVPPPPPPPPLSSMPPVADQLVAQPIDAPAAFPVPIADAAPQAYPAQPDSVQATYTLQDGTQAAYAVARTVSQSLDTSPVVPAAAPAPVSYAAPLAHPVISDASGLKYAPQVIQQGVVIATPCATPCTGQVVQGHPSSTTGKANVKPLTMVSIEETSKTYQNTSGFPETEIAVKGTPVTPDIPAGLVAPSTVPAPIPSVPATPITPTTSTFRYDPYADPESPGSNFVRKIDLSPSWKEGGGDSDCGFSTPHQGSGSALVLPLFPDVYAA